MAIDPVRELRELFAHERMIAFFDVTLPLPGSPTGIARVNRPVDPSGSGHYLAVLLLVDTPDEERRERVVAFLAAVPWSTWADRVHALDVVLAMPDAESPPGLVQKEIDVYLRADTSIANDEVVEALHRTLPALSGIAAGPITRWEDVSPGPAAAPADPGASGIVSRIAGLLRRGPG